MRELYEAEFERGITLRHALAEAALREEDLRREILELSSRVESLQREVAGLRHQLEVKAAA